MSQNPFLSLLPGLDGKDHFLMSFVPLQLGHTGLSP